MKKLLRKKHTTEESGHMILISNPWLLSRFFSGASDTLGTQESSSLSKTFTEKEANVPKSASYPHSFCSAYHGSFLNREIKGSRKYLIIM